MQQIHSGYIVTKDPKMDRRSFPELWLIAGEKWGGATGSTHRRCEETMNIYVAFRSGLLQDDVCRVLLQVHPLTGAHHEPDAAGLGKKIHIEVN